MSVLEIELTNYISELKNIVDEEEKYLSGLFNFYSFEEDKFEDVYRLTQNYFGDRDRFVIDRLETSWSFKTDRDRTIKIKLYDDSIEIYSVIAENFDSITDFNSITQEFTNSEKAEYLQKKKERRQFRLHKLNLDSEKLTQEELDKLNTLKKKRASLEIYFENKRKEELDNELSEIRNRQKKELDRIESIESELEDERQKLKAESRLKEILEVKEKKERELYRLKKLKAEKEKATRIKSANETLPEGYDYNAKFYEQKLIALRNKYGQDSEIDNSMKKWSSRSILNKKDFKRLYAKRYVELYKNKYEGKSISKGYYSPKNTNKSVQDADKEDNRDNLYLFIFLIIILAVFYGFGCLIAPDCP